MTKYNSSNNTGNFTGLKQVQSNYFRGRDDIIKSVTKTRNSTVQKYKINKLDHQKFELLVPKLEKLNQFIDSKQFEFDQYATADRSEI